MTKNGTSKAPTRQSPRLGGSYAIDVETETMLPTAAVSKWLDKRKLGRPHLAVVRRWMRVGARGIPLPSVMVGGRRFTSEQALRWWFDAAGRQADAVVAVEPAGQAFAVGGGDGLSVADRATLQAAGFNLGVTK